MSSRFEERRHYTRVALHTPLKYAVQGRGENFNSICTEVGGGGCSFVSEKFLPARTPIQLNMQVLSRMVSAQGRIASVSQLAHSPRYRLGVQFSSLDKDSQEFLDEFVAMRSHAEI